MLTNNDLNKIDELFTKRLSLQEEKLSGRFKSLEKAIRSIKKDIKTIVSFFEHECLDLRKRVDRIENHLHLTEIS